MTNVVIAFLSNDVKRRFATLTDVKRRFATLTDVKRRFATLTDVKRRFVTLTDVKRQEIKSTYFLSADVGALSHHYSRHVYILISSTFVVLMKRV
jgi:hypothetical protein